LSWFKGNRWRQKGVARPAGTERVNCTMNLSKLSLDWTIDLIVFVGNIHVSNCVRSRQSNGIVALRRWNLQRFRNVGTKSRNVDTSEKHNKINYRIYVYTRTRQSFFLVRQTTANLVLKWIWSLVRTTYYGRTTPSSWYGSITIVNHLSIMLATSSLLRTKYYKRKRLNYAVFTGIKYSVSKYQATVPATDGAAMREENGKHLVGVRTDHQPSYSGKRSRECSWK